MNDKSRQIIEIVKDIEANIHGIPRSDQQDFRNKVLHIPNGFVDGKHSDISSIGREIVHNLKITEEFLRNNKDLMCTNADKGYITVLIRRSEYISDLEQLLNDVENFERQVLQSNLLRFLDSVE